MLENWLHTLWIFSNRTTASELQWQFNFSVPSRISNDNTTRLLIGISGIPASGKSTLAQLVVQYTNAHLQELRNHSEQFVPPEAILVGLDGWHLTRKQLDAFPNPKTAHDRRGIHWSFDGDGYVSFVQALRKDLPPDAVNTIITAPSFDHALKDPTPNAVSIHPFHLIVVIEGLYTYLSIDPWKKAGQLLDERWFVDIGFEEATARLVKRHVSSGVAKDLEEAIWRAQENDMPSSYT